MGILDAPSAPLAWARDLRSYGADPTGAVSSSAALAAAVAALDPVHGGEIYAAGRFLIDSTVTFDRPVSIRGAGAGDHFGGVGSLESGTGGTAVGSSNVSGTTYDARNTAGTVFFCNSTTLTMFDVTHPAFQIVACALVNITTGTPTAGIGLRIRKGEGLVIDRCRFVNFYDNVAVEQYEYARIQCNLFLDPVHYGLQIRNLEVSDQGDVSLVSNVFSMSGHINRTATSAFQWESGGGLRAFGNKVNMGPRGGIGKFQTAFDIKVADGVGTSVMLFEANSIENTQYGFLFQSQGSNTGQVSKIIISGNEIYVNTLNAPIVFAPAVTGRFYDIQIFGNHLHGGTYSISLAKVNKVLVGPNQTTGYANNGIIDVGASVTNLTRVSDGAMTKMARASTGAAIVNNTNTALIWDTTVFDDRAWYNAGASTTRVTVDRAGRYRITAAMGWQSNNTGVRICGVYINNGTTPIISDSRAASGLSGCTMTQYVVLAKDDYIELKVYQNSGISLNTAVGTDHPNGSLVVEYLG